MTRHKTLTDHGVTKLKPRSSRHAYPDPQMAGLFVKVQPTGTKTFACVSRDPFGRQKWVSLGRSDHVKIEDARERAREVIARIKAGKVAVEPPPPKPDTFRDVAEGWYQRHVVAKGLRTQADIRRQLTKYVYPTWAERELTDIRKSDTARLLDHIEDNHGARQADAILAIISSVLHWAAARSDNFTVPLSRGMRRTSTKERARTRVLSDGEIKLVWSAVEASGSFGGVIQLLLLSGQRLRKVVQMRWADIAIDGTWTIRTDAREKGNPGTLVLPAKAIEIIRQQPRFANSEFVFAGSGDGRPIGGFSGRKRRFDLLLPPDMPAWCLHDLRRSARSMLSRCDVRPDISEKVLGHVQPGILSVYDRHGYVSEMADALRRLAALIGQIVDPPTGKKVVPLRKVAVDA